MLSVKDSRELQATVLALKVMDRDLAKAIRAATVSTMNPVWKSEVSTRVRTNLDRAVLLPGARIAGGNPPAAVAGASSRKMRGGASPGTLSGPVEFGTAREVKKTYTTHSRRGTAYTVTRRTRRQLPPKAIGGRVVFPAFKDIAPRMVSLWVQLVVKKVYDALPD